MTNPDTAAAAGRIAAQAVRDAARRFEPRPDGCRPCAERDQPVADEMYRIAAALDDAGLLRAEES